jgi:hypothetical protein
MTDEQIALARRAVACKGWRWMPGMSYWWCGSQDRVVDDERGTLRTDGDLLPDLQDPATLGCMLALVREAWGEPTYLPTCLDAHDEAWVIESPAQDRQTRYGSYASVLVATLESAPSPKENP